MPVITRSVLFVLFLVVSAPFAYAQTHFKECVSRTADNATVILHEGTNVMAAGRALENSDEIAVIAEDGKCVGVGVWSGSSIAITVWGADQFSNIGGLQSGHALKFVVWDASANLEYRDVNVTYAGGKPYLRTDGVYANGAVYELSTLTASGATGTDSEEENEAEFALEQNFPNPVNVSTTIAYSLEEPVDVQLEVFNMLGQRVQVLVAEPQAAGRHEVSLDAQNLPSGAYIYRLRAGEYTETRNMLVVK